MDLTRDIIYRSFLLNDQDIVANIVPGGAIGSGTSGSVVDSVDFSDVDVVQFLEKKALQDGMEAGDVYHGARRIRMAGTIYDVTRALLYDRWANLKAALNPVLAQRESPADKGYLPLYFSVPTNRVADYPAGAIDLRVLAMPRAIGSLVQRDNLGGEDGDALAIPWQATFICKDPTIQGETPQDYAFAGYVSEVAVTGVAATDLFTKTTHGLAANDRVNFTVLVGGTGLTANVNYYIISDGLTADAFKVSLTQGGAAVNFTTDVTAGSYYAKVKTFTGNTVNRGNYIAPMNALFVVGNRAGTIALTVGDSAFSIVLPASTGARTVRYKGEDKILTVEENSVELLYMAGMSFTAGNTHPLIPSGTAAYSITVSGLGSMTDTVSHMWFWERHA